MVLLYRNDTLIQEDFFDLSVEYNSALKAKGREEDLGESGKVVGRLGACNTVGSIIGTFLPTFVTIPSIGTAYSFLLFAGLLLALAVAYYLFSGLLIKTLGIDFVIGQIKKRNFSGEAPVKSK